MWALHSLALEEVGDGSHGYTETGRTRLGPFEVILFEKRLV